MPFFLKKIEIDILSLVKAYHIYFANDYVV